MLRNFLAKIITFLRFIFYRSVEFLKFIRFEISYLRDALVIHPRIIIWRVSIMRYSPLLSRYFLRIIGSFVLILSFFISFYIFSWSAPRDFPDQALVEVDRGETLSQIADHFQNQKIVRSSFWLKFFILLTGGERRVIAGDYFFPNKVSIFKVVRTLHKGEFGLIPIRVTIFEGSSSIDIAKLLQETLPAFDANEFIRDVENGNHEGYLFPDTYFFMPNTKPDDVILAMRENFARQIKTYEEDILKSGRPLEELVIMASIIEGEGNTLESKRLISGILWKRMKIDMPLQVDAPFRYYNGKHSYTLTKEDLGEDHPYNTYVNKGLPPTAITNPGIDSLRAAIAPTNSEYLFFMSDKYGNTYYAKNFDGHQSNRENYLR